MQLCPRAALTTAIYLHCVLQDDGAGVLLATVVQLGRRGERAPVYHGRCHTAISPPPSHRKERGAKGDMLRWDSRTLKPPSRRPTTPRTQGGDVNVGRRTRRGERADRYPNRGECSVARDRRRSRDGQGETAGSRRMAELQDLIRRTERRATEVREEPIALSCRIVDEKALVDALSL